MKITFKQLSGPLKTLVVFGWIMVGITAIYMALFMIGLVAILAGY